MPISTKKIKTAKKTQQKGDAIWIQNKTKSEHKKNSKKVTKIVQNTFKRVDFPHPLDPTSVQNYLQGMKIEQSLRTGTSCVCLSPLKKIKKSKSKAWMKTVRENVQLKSEIKEERER